MKTLKGIAIVCLGVLGFVACDNSYEFLDTFNEAPVASFSKSDGLTLYDTLKTSIKNGREEYTFELDLSDNDGFVTALYFEVKNGVGSVIWEGSAVDAISGMSDGKITMGFKPENETNYEIIITAIDNLGLDSQSTLYLTVFDNLPPVADFDVTFLGVNSGLEYTLDGSTAYDADASHGGDVVLWKYEINDVELLTDLEKEKFIFPARGTYEIKLVVTDNDGETSPQVTKVVTI
jgi:hypothetical protein